MRMAADPSPLLRAVLDAELRDDIALRSPSIQGYARAVALVAERLTQPLLWPVGVGGQRLLGALEVLSEATYEARGWRTDVSGRIVLLIATVGVSGLEVAAEAAAARTAGAFAVHACAIDTAVGCARGLDSFVQLDASTRALQARLTA